MGFDSVVVRFMNQVVEYLPSLAGGLLLAALGWAVAWFVKRTIVQVCMTLKHGRLLGQFHWGRSLSGAAVRHSLYNLLGSLGRLIVFLVFLDTAFTAMRLTAVASHLERIVSLFPRVVTALAIFALGWLISFWASMAIRRTLHREGVPRASLVSGYARAMLLLLFAAMVIAELDIAPKVVVIGFTVIYVTLGALTVILTIKGGQGIIQRLLGTLAGR